MSPYNLATACFMNLFWCNINIKTTQYNSTNEKLSNLQFNKLKSVTKNETGITLRLSSNMIGNTNDETNFPHKLLLRSNYQKLNYPK